ncbi:hypothetical protein AB4Z52_13560, partial [Rhizobium sp. 2YAF20]|uniref:hypothetical protein n=1 Tax=Rhizobium sp. 2YAF20 TaxID=3233027 RepID=UPI003F9AB9FD
WWPADFGRSAAIGSTVIVYVSIPVENLIDCNFGDLEIACDLPAVAPIPRLVDFSVGRWHYAAF